MSLCEQGVMQGTIPYLGTFLTDLVMMDTAMKDYTEVRHLTCVFTVISLFTLLDVSSFSHVQTKSFSGWSDQLREEKKGELNSLFCYDLK